MPAYGTEDEIIKILNTLDDEGNAYKRDLDRRVNENLRLHRGEQWRGPDEPAFLMNVIQTDSESKVGKLSETRPKIRISASRNGLEKASDVLNRACQSLWDTNRLEYKTERLGMWGVLSGVACMITPFDKRLNFGDGDIDISVRDPRTVIVDTGIVEPEDFARRWEYCCLWEPIPLSRIGSLYPGRGTLVKPDDGLSTYSKSDVDRLSTRSMIASASKKIFGRGKDQQSSVIPRAIVREYYVQDRRKTVDGDGLVPLLQGVSTWPEKGEPFPGGRHITRAGDVILEDEPNPYWDGIPPLDLLSWKVDVETPWGPDEVQDVKRMQEAINRSGNAFAKSLFINTVVRLIMDKGAMEPDERNKLSNFIGQIIEVRQGRKAQLMVPQPLPADTLNFIDKLIGWMQHKRGVIENPLQKRVPSIVTGPALEGLQLMIETPIRTAARRIEEFYGRIGQKLIARIFQYYTSDRVLDFVGPSEEWRSFMFERQKLIEKYKPEDLPKAWRDFRFHLEPGSSLAITRVQRSIMKTMYMDRGLLHPREAMEESGIENADEKIKEAQDAIKSGLIMPLQKKDGRGGSDASQIAKTL